MSRREELIAEIERVQKEINNANTTMKTQPTHFGDDFTESFKRKGPALAPRVASEFSKAVQRGKPEEIIIGGVLIGVAWVGSYAIDFIADSISEAKAKKILLACYDELAVKQNMLIDEQQRLVEEILIEGKLQEEELRIGKERLQELTTQLNSITQLLKERSV